MAMTSDAGRGPAAQPVNTAPRAAPAWVVPLYVAGLILVYLGERVLATWEQHWILSAIGALAAVLATALRFSPRFRAGGERQGIENLLAILSALGVLGLAIYTLTTDWGMDLIGVSTATPETRTRVLGVLTVVWISLILVSVVPMIFAETALYPMRRALVPESRRVRLAAINGLTLALAAIYGSLFVYAAADVGATADFSYFKTSKPSDSTRHIAESLSEPVTVIAFFPDVNEAKTEVERYLRELTKGLSTLKFEVKDHLLVPKLASELHVTQDGVIVLKRGASTESLIIGTDMKDARPKLKTLDQDFQERLLKLARSRRNAYLTTGHGELTDDHPGSEETGRSGRLLHQLLTKQNYTIKDLGLAQGLGNEVPDDADLVLVLGPSEPFAPEEIESLKRYGDRGGHLLLALDPDVLSEKDLADDETVSASERRLDEEPAPGKPEAADAGATARDGHGKLAHHAADGGAAAAHKPATARMANAPGKDRVSASLDALGDIVGIKRIPGVLANDREHLRRRFNDSDNTLLLTSSFSSHASVSTLSRSSRAAIVAFGAGAIEGKPGAPGAIDYAIRSRANTFPDRNENYTADPDEKREVYNLAAAITVTKTPPAKSDKDKSKKDDKNAGKKPPPNEMRAFVIGDADAFSDVVFANVIANQILFVDAVRWLTGEESFAGQQTTEEDRAIEHTKQKDQVWFYATIFGAPAVVLGLGILYSKRSRRGRKRGGRS